MKQFQSALCLKREIFLQHNDSLIREVPLGFDGALITVCIDCFLAAGWHSAHPGLEILICTWLFGSLSYYYTQGELFRCEHRLVTTGDESTDLQVGGS